jgi:hypothetical protein
MKRSGFRQQSPEEVKQKQALKRKKLQSVAKKPKTPLKAKNKPLRARKKRTERQKLEDKLWTECKRIIRGRYGDKCYTCPAEGLVGCNQQTGHGKPKGALPMQFKYDLRNLRVQCMNCNIHLGGVSDIFITKLENEIQGLYFLKESCRYEDGWIIRKETNLVGKEATIFLQELLEEYKGIT